MKILNAEKIKRQAQELQQLIKKYDRRTEGFTDEMAIGLMNAENRDGFLELLSIVDCSRIGKSRAILFSFKIGYLQGRAERKPDAHELDFQNFISDVALDLQKASVTLLAAIETNLLDKTDLTKDEMMVIGGNASNICDLLVIVDDYVRHAQEKLEGILE